MGITVAMLKDQTHEKGSRPFLYCVVCGAENSANKADYFLASPSFMFVCCDDVPMVLVTKKAVFASFITE